MSRRTVLGLVLMLAGCRRGSEAPWPPELLMVGDANGVAAYTADANMLLYGQAATPGKVDKIWAFLNTAPLMRLSTGAGAYVDLVGRGIQTAPQEPPANDLVLSDFAFQFTAQSLLSFFAYANAAPASPGHVRMESPNGVADVQVGSGAPSLTILDSAVIATSNDCNNVFESLRVSNASLQEGVIVTAQDLGWDGSSVALTCNPNAGLGTLPQPVGCGVTTHLAGESVVCALGQTGNVVFMDPNTGVYLQTATGGRGPGSIVVDSGIAYVAQFLPRAGSATLPGTPCQVGQIAAVDVASGSLVGAYPALYDGPGCSRSLNPNEADAYVQQLIPVGNKLFAIPSSDNPGGALALMVFDIGVGGALTQLPSLPLGRNTGQRAATFDSNVIWIANNVDLTLQMLPVNASSDGEIVLTGINASALATYYTPHPTD